MSAPDPNLAKERARTRELLSEVEKATKEGVRAYERLRLATKQYRERAGLPPLEKR